MHKGFIKQDFELFSIEGLEDRMNIIRNKIQPVFQDLGDTYAPMIQDEIGYPMQFHIAQHRRRTSNPPESTWCAIGGDVRGYKKYPHLQIGINEDHIFIFISIIDNPLYEIEMGKALLSSPENLNSLTEQFVLSGDHTKSKIEPVSEEKMIEKLNRLLKVKKGEFLIGRVIERDSDLLENIEAQNNYIKQTINQLIPLYRQLLDIHFEQSESA